MALCSAATAGSVELAVAAPGPSAGLWSSCHGAAGDTMGRCLPLGLLAFRASCTVGQLVSSRGWQCLRWYCSSTHTDSVLGTGPEGCQRALLGSCDGILLHQQKAFVKTDQGVCGSVERCALCPVPRARLYIWLRQWMLEQAGHAGVPGGAATPGRAAVYCGATLPGGY